MLDIQLVHHILQNIKIPKYIQSCHDVMYSGEYNVCFATLSVYPHPASIPKVVGSNPTVARYIFQACPVWIYNQCSNTYIIYKSFVHIKDFLPQSFSIKIVSRKTKLASW